MATLGVDSTESVDVELENMQDNETQGIVGQSDIEGSQDSRKRKFNVWDWFTRYVAEDGKKRARCKCNKTYAADPKRDGITNLRRHLQVCPERKSDEIRQMVSTQDAKIHSRQIDQETCREMIVRVIVIHNLPFSFVEYEAIRQLLTYLNPDIKHMSRNTAKAVMLKIYKREKESLKEVLRNIMIGSYEVTLIIAFSHFPPPHTGNALCENLMACLKEWGIEKKVFSLTLDNAASNDVMQQSMKRQMKVDNLLICDGKHFHVRCCAHILNLIVQDGLKVIDGALQRIRESVRYVKGSEGRRVHFQKCVEQMRINTTVGLRTDVPTRWNSTFDMLQSALRYRKAFEQLDCVDDGYKFIPSDEEWDRAERIANFLMPFAQITTLFSGREYVTSNLYFLHVWRIQVKLIEQENSIDEVISNMAKEMKEKFDKYWEDYRSVLAFALILDPRYKMTFVTFCYNKLDDSPLKLNAKIKLDRIKKELYELFDEYVKLVPIEPLGSSGTPQAIDSLASTTQMEVPDDEFDILYNAESESTSELDIYLEEMMLNRKKYPDFDVLNYWRTNKNRFPVLSIMARDIMSIPITTVASESAFSMGSRLLTKYRSSILPRNVEALICLQNWLCGYEVDDLEIEDEDQEVVEDVSKSN